MRNSTNIILILGLVVFPMTAVRSSFADDSSPDPRALLAGVEKDRLSLKSGRLELDLALTSPKRPHEGTTRMRLVIEFDGENRRFDTYQRSLTVPWLRHVPGSASTEPQLVELIGSREAIVREGLGYWLDSHTRTIYDGKQLMRYSKNQSTSVGDLNPSPALNAFDPRILGLSHMPRPSETLHSDLTPRPNESVTLVGREEVGGNPAWHVLIGGAGDGRDLERHFWIEPPPGHRVYRTDMRSKLGRGEVISEYGLPGGGERLPIRVTARRNDPDGTLVQELIIERKKSEFDVPIDPKTWTFAGLGMPVGEPVTDHRVKRVIGYWDGQRLSETPVPQAPEVRDEAPQINAAKLLDVARRDRGGRIALDALTQIVRRAPVGPEAGEAVKLLTEYHAGMKGVGEIGRELVESQPEGTEQFFRSILARNPDREEQGNACFNLAEILKERSERRGRGEAGDAAAAEAERLFERVVSSYGDVRKFHLGSTLGESTRTNLYELRNLGIGKTAPEIHGEDLDGKPLSLDAHRGKVVMVVFWATWCAPCLRMVPHERELVTRMKGQPFALLGVSGDNDREQAKATAGKYAMTWPSWWQGGGGGFISTGWNVRAWPRVYVLDSKGVIRFKNLSGRALDEAVESLVEEAGRG
jgi:thiol-disulfide isomerase/thioredoxin